MEPIFRGQFKMLLVKARPVDQMPLVDLEDAIEAGIEDRRQGHHTLGKSRFFADKGQADSNNDLGRTKIDASEWDINLLVAKYDPGKKVPHIYAHTNPTLQRGEYPGSLAGAL
jgi:hypothetical protein